MQLPVHELHDINVQQHDSVLTHITEGKNTKQMSSGLRSDMVLYTPYVKVNRVFLWLSSVSPSHGYSLPHHSHYNIDNHPPILEEYCNEFVGSIHDGTILHSKFSTQLLITVSNFTYAAPPRKPNM
jgi:hypothetical protein